MNWQIDDWGDIASLLGIVLPMIGFLGWMIRRWIHQLAERLTREVVPNLTNDGTSAASYAHQAAEAAIEAKNAAVQAKDAAVEAKDAAVAAKSISLEIKRILES
jgi:hypothetical protein